MVSALPKFRSPDQEKSGHWSSHGLVRPHPTAPMDFGPNSNSFLGAAAFCTTIIGDFRTQPQKLK